MLIPLGFLASSGAKAAGSFDLISTTILGSSAASVTFDVTGLGSTYKHLQIRATARNSESSEASVYARVNSDSGNNYSWHGLYGDGSGVGSFGYSSSWSQMGLARIIGSSYASNSFSGIVMDFLDPFSTSKNKTVRALSGSTGYNAIRLQSGAWLSTSATTSITFTLETGNFVTGSRFSLYGLKG